MDMWHAYQPMVCKWLRTCLDGRAEKHVPERSYRFFEEAAELVQSTGMTREQCHELVDYVFGRPVGEVKQEVGGVMVTLACLCGAVDVSMMQCGLAEANRIKRPEVMAKIRAKQAAKPRAVTPYAGVPKEMTGG